MPASSESLRRESRATRRCSRMNSPRSCMRVSRSFIPRSTVREWDARVEVGPRRASAEERLDGRLAALVAADELALQDVDALMETAAATGDIGLELAEAAGQGTHVVVGCAREVRQPRGVDDRVDFGHELSVVGWLHRRGQATEAGAEHLATKDFGQLLDERRHVGGLAALGTPVDLGGNDVEARLDDSPYIREGGLRRLTLVTHKAD